MNLETLHLYCDVIRSGSFSLGAAAHRISQSAASQSVRQLEEELEVQLIDRTKRPFMVTPEGRKFFEACLTLIEDFEKAKADITEQLLSGLPARRQPPKTVPPLRRPEVRARLGLDAMPA